MATPRSASPIKGAKLSPEVSHDTTLAFDDVEKGALGHKNTTFSLPNAVTIQEDDEALVRENRLRRQSSVGLGRPQRADGPSRVIGEFR